MVTSTSKPTSESASRPSRMATSVGSLDELVGGHPHAMHAIFARGAAADPADLGEMPTGRLIALEPLVGVHLAARPIVRAIARTPLWSGVGFDHGGNAGFNRVLGARALRFRASVQPSALDGRPALVLAYDRNAWPFGLLRDELRSAGPGLAIGAFFARAGERHVLLGWFGLEADATARAS